MKFKLLVIIAVVTLFSLSVASLVTSDYSKYIEYRQIENLPTYQGYLRLGMYSMRLPLNEFVRQPFDAYPGDYFWPPQARFRRVPDINYRLVKSEIQSLIEFLNANVKKEISDSILQASLSGYAYDFPSGPRREAYAMLSEGDTVYVVSGWLGKFLSFYRVVPGGFRLDASGFMKELEKITPLAKEIKESGFRHESDSLNYLWEYVDKDKMFRVRNYLMRTVLPPMPPDSPERLYNLIEITRFYDKEAIP